MASFEEVAASVREGIMDGLRDLGNVVIDKGNAMIEDQSMDRGSLLESSEIKEFPDELMVIVAWTAKHSVYVHYGTGPARGRDKYWPNKEAIEDWVKRNLRTRRFGGRTVLKPLTKEGTRMPTKQEFDDVTWLVMKKIHDEGIEPVPYATTGAAAARSQATQKVRDGINDALRRL